MNPKNYAMYVANPFRRADSVLGKSWYYFCNFSTAIIKPKNMNQILQIVTLGVFLTFFSIADTHATVIVTNGLSHTHRMANVDKTRGIVEIKNVGKKPQRVRFYVKDQSMDCETGGSFFDAGTIDRTNAKWITLATSETILDTGQVFELAYEINKPSDLQERGSFWSMIMVENVPDVSTDAPQQGVMVRSNLRYAVQIISEVGEETDYDLEFDTVYYNVASKSLVMEISTPSISIMRMYFEMRIFSDSGAAINQADESYTKLYPSTCRRIEIPLTEAEAGNYDGVVIAKSDSQGVFGYNVRFEIPR